MTVNATSCKSGSMLVNDSTPANSFLAIATGKSTRKRNGLNGGPKERKGKGRVMSRIIITIDTEYIPDRFVGWPDVNIVLRCKPKDKYKAELVADLIAGMDCFDIGGSCK